MSANILKQRFTRGLLITSLGAGCVTGCSSGINTPDTKPSTPSIASNTPSTNPSMAPQGTKIVCKADHPEAWTVIPRNFKVLEIAKALSVPLNDIAQGGRFGAATCATGVEVDRIGTTTPVIVATPGEGDPCLVIGTIDPPVIHTLATKIMAICANDPSKI